MKNISLKLNAANKNNSTLLKKKTKSILSSVLRYAFLGSLGYIVIFQLAYMLSYAFRPESQMYDPSVVWLPKYLSFENFGVAIEQMEYLKSFWISTSVLILSAMIQVVSASFAAYGFARFKFKGKGLLFAFVIVSIVVPEQLIALPMYLTFAHFDVFGSLKLIGLIFGTDIRPNLLNTGFPFWLPALFGVGIRSGLCIFIYRQFFKGLPKELEEAAALDGASPLKTFLRVIWPSSGTAVLTVSILSIVWHWNDYYHSILYYNDSYPLSVKLSQLASSMQGTGLDNRGVRMVGCLLFIFPVLFLYSVLQRKFIASIDSVGIVG